MTAEKPIPTTTPKRMHPDQQPFADFIWDQTQYPEADWEFHTIGHDPVALAVLDVLDHWRRNQDSEAAIDLLQRAIKTVRWYQGCPPPEAISPRIDATQPGDREDGT